MIEYRISMEPRWRCLFRFSPSSICSLLVFMLFVTEINSGSLRDDSVIPLRRNKRYVAFPDGSAMIFAFCMTAQTILPFQIFTEGVNWGISYALPNSSSLLDGFNRKPSYLLHRRQRRDLYTKFEVILDSMGYDGRSCIFRSLCEAARLVGEKTTLLERLLKIFFTFPQQTLLNSEPEEHRLYHWAYRRGNEDMQQDCAEMFPACSISLLDLALGYYNSD